LGLFIDKKIFEINHIDDADEYLATILAQIDVKTVERRWRSAMSRTTASIEQGRPGCLINQPSHLNCLGSATAPVETIAVFLAAV
jgi:hypothetical protein